MDQGEEVKKEKGGGRGGKNIRKKGKREKTNKMQVKVRKERRGGRKLNG